MNVSADFPQFERSLILKRTEEDRIPTMSCGVMFERPEKMQPDQANRAYKFDLDGEFISAVARIFNDAGFDKLSGFLSAERQTV